MFERFDDFEVPAPQPVLPPAAPVEYWLRPYKQEAAARPCKRGNGDE